MKRRVRKVIAAMNPLGAVKPLVLDAAEELGLRRPPEVDLDKRRALEVAGAAVVGIVAAELVDGDGHGTPDDNQALARVLADERRKREAAEAEAAAAEAEAAAERAKLERVRRAVRRAPVPPERLS